MHCVADCVASRIWLAIPQPTERQHIGNEIDAAIIAAWADFVKPGGAWGWVSALDSEGRTIWIADAHGYGKRFIVRADELLTAFLELESAIRSNCIDIVG